MPKRKLEIELIGDSSSLSKTFRGAVREADTFGSRLRHAGVVGAQVLGTAVVAGVAAVTVGIVKSAQAAEEANKVHAQTGAVVKTTGHAAGVTQGQVESLSESIMRKTGIDDEAILTGQNLLLTFKDIKNEAGEGNDIFDQATQAMVDMSAAMGKEASGSAIQLGKALNDPIKGISALQKSGVSFSEQQKKQIEQWVEEGDKLRAQKAILRELKSEFGGSAAAQATAMEKIKTSVGNVQESIGNVFLPIIDQAANKLNRDFVPELQHTADGLAKIAARKDIDLSEKLKLGGDVIKRDWGDVPEQIGEVVDDAVPIVAERSGQLGIAAAEGMLHGFVHADPLGKAAILLFASKAFGGPAAVVGAGKSFGSKFGGAAAAESALAWSTFGVGPSGAKAFGLIDKAKGVGKTVGKAGLAVGLLSGLSAGLEDADSPSQHLQNALSAASFGLIPEADGSWANQITEGLMADWDDQLPALQKHIQGRTLEALAKDRGKLAWTYKVAVATGASEEHIDALREKLNQLDRTISGIKSAGRNVDSGVSGLEGGKFTRLGDIKSVVAANSKAIANSTERGSQDARDAMARNYNAAAKAIETGMNRGVIATKTGMAEIQRLTRSAHLISGDDPWGIAKGFQRSWEKSGTITRQSLNGITKDLGKMPPAAAQVTGEMMIGMARQMRAKGQLSKAEMERLRSAVVTKLDLMARQGGKKGDAFRSNVATPIGGLSIDVAEALENIGVNVGGILDKLGADNPLQGFTLNYFKGKGAAGKGKGYLDQVPEFKAQGGPVTVPGQGRHDSVPLFVNGAMSAVVAPGEKLAAITQHQSPLLDRAVYNEYGVAGLDGFFNTFDRPHYLAKGGFSEPRISGPDPLRGGAQAGIHKSYKAAQAYLKAHRPKPSPAAGGNTAYVGPPPNMRQLGDNSWVDSHTLAVLGFVAGKFGMSVTDGFRTPEEAMQYPSGMGSFHTHGSPSNPGAGDISQPGATEATLIPVRNFMAQHVAGIAEGPLIDNVAGWNMHTGFFARGGKLIGLSSGGFAGDGYTVKGDSASAQQENTAKEIMEAADKTGAGHLARVAALMAATQESNMGSTGNTFQLTGDFEGVSPSDSAYTQAVQWFTKGYYHGGGIGLSKKFSNPGDIAQEVEGSAYPDAYDPWKGEAQKWVDGWAGDAGDPGSGPASKGQKHTLGALQHKAAGVLREARKLKAEYKKYGGTKRGRQALARTLKFAKEAAAKAKAGNRDAAKKLIDKARDSIGKSRDSYGKAAEGVFTPGLKPGALPELGTTTYDPGQAFSATNLPGLGVLPPELKKILKAPGLDWAGKYGALETTLSMAGMTDTKVDDAASLNAMLGMDRKKREHLKAQLRKLDKELGRGGLTKKQRATLVDKRNKVMAGLGEVAGHVGSIHGQIAGLNEEGEGEAEEDPAVKASEEAKQASEELKASIDELDKTIKAQAQRESSEQAITANEATRAVSDMLAGYLGQKTDHNAHVAGAGRVGTL